MCKKALLQLELERLGEEMPLAESRSQGRLEEAATLEEELDRGTLWLGLSVESRNSREFNMNGG